MTLLLLNSRLLSVTFLLVRAPEQGSVRPTYSFVHMRLAMFAVVDSGGHTISSGAGGPHTRRSLCPQAWTIGCKSWPVPERDLFLLLLRPGRAGGVGW